MRKANLPRCCPSCGSHEIQPLFWVDADVWSCSNPRCYAIFSERD